MNYKKLQDAGLNENEAKIYLAVLELVQTSVSRIARKSGVKRTTVYFSLENLMQKGLISAIKKEGRTEYFAEDPRNLERIAEEKKQRISSFIPELLAFTNIIDKKPEIHYFEGEEGIKEVISDTLEYSEEICALYSESYIHNFEEDFFTKFYRPERVKRKIPARVILPDNEEMRAVAAKNQEELRQSKFISSDLFKIKFQMMIYGKNKVDIISYEEKFAFIIESQIIYDSFKSIFETLWAKTD